MTDDIVKTGSKCYIVFANGGEWEDSWSNPSMESNPPECLGDLKALQEYALHLKKENERLQKELSLLLLSQITENDQKLGLYE